MPTKEEIIEFSETISSISYHHNIDIMDAVVLYCEENKLEVELAATLLSPPLKAQIREDAENLNLLKKESRLTRLPI